MQPLYLTIGLEYYITRIFYTIRTGIVYHNLYNSTATDVPSTLLTAAVLEDKCYISLQQDKTYNQKDVLYFFRARVGSQGLVTIFIFFPNTLKTTREESKMSNFHTTLFQNSFVLVS
jgi:hypothetical protein